MATGVSNDVEEGGSGAAGGTRVDLSRGAGGIASDGVLLSLGCGLAVTAATFAGGGAPAVRLSPAGAADKAGGLALGCGGREEVGAATAESAVAAPDARSGSVDRPAIGTTAVEFVSVAACAALSAGVGGFGGGTGTVARSATVASDGEGAAFTELALECACSIHVAPDEGDDAGN